MEGEYIVTEVCPHCENEIEMRWSVEEFGYKAFCPVCGNRLMLCDECQHGEGALPCDYDGRTGSCRFNLEGKKMKKVSDLKPGDKIRQDGVEFTVKHIFDHNGMTAIQFEDVPCTPETMAAYGKLLKLSAQEIKKRRENEGE